MSSNAIADAKAIAKKIKTEFEGSSTIAVVSSSDTGNQNGF